MPNKKMSGLKDEVVREAALRAEEILSGMGYHGRFGSIHLLRLDLQANTITAILHNIVAWQISQLDSRWNFRPKGGPTPDLIDSEGNGIQIKATSNKYIKGNRVSPNEGFYIAVMYDRKQFEIEIREILAGELLITDWNRPSGTQWAILKPEAKKKLRRIYP